MAGESVEHCSLLLAAAAVEERVKLGVLPQQQALERDDCVFELSAALRLGAELVLQQHELLAEAVVLTLQRLDHDVLVLESRLKLAVQQLWTTCIGGCVVVQNALASEADKGFGFGGAKVLGHWGGRGGGRAAAEDYTRYVLWEGGVARNI